MLLLSSLILTAGVSLWPFCGSLLHKTEHHNKQVSLFYWEEFILFIKAVKAACFNTQSSLGTVQGFHWDPSSQVYSPKVSTIQNIRQNITTLEKGDSYRKGFSDNTVLLHYIMVLQGLDIIAVRIMTVNQLMGKVLLLILDAY